MRDFITAELTPENYSKIINEICRKTMLKIEREGLSRRQYANILASQIDLLARTIAIISCQSDDEEWISRGPVMMKRDFDAKFSQYREHYKIKVKQMREEG